jgi:cytochrome P450
MSDGTGTAPPNYDPNDTEVYGPVADWATDLDHADPAYNPHAPEIWEQLRESGCPIARSDRYGGMWAPITHEFVKEVAYDTDHFSSRGVVVSRARPIIPAPVGPAPPITSDPPFHQIARRLLLPPFSPKAIDPWEPEIRLLCRRLLDDMGDIVDGESVVDAAVQYAQHIPVNVISRMLGFPPGDDDLFRTFVHDVIEGVNLPPEQRFAKFEVLDQYLAAQLADHRANPRDDLTTYLMNVEIDGNKLAPEHVRGSIVLLLIAGIDTTWSAIGSSLWHLAQHPDDLERLTTDPDVMLYAIEEFLRHYAPVTMARLVATDHELAGCPLKEGDWMLLPFPAANRDPEMFENPDEVVLDRQKNRHGAFGLGIHRCLGSNLARMELTVAIEVWLERFAGFELFDPATVRWSGGQIRGPRELPVRILDR